MLSCVGGNRFVYVCRSVNVYMYKYASNVDLCT